MYATQKFYNMNWPELCMYVHTSSNMYRYLYTCILLTFPDIFDLQVEKISGKYSINIDTRLQ